ncbi:MAG: hypothetical protein HY069_03120 [Chlamydiia bacterium]|nr:hypothetical protein [Chlamydiia bacterium]
MRLALLAIFPLAICYAGKQEDIPPPKSSKNPPPYDADLFRREEQVISIDAEFLFWRVQEGCLDYALVMNHTAWGPALTNNYAQGKLWPQTWSGEPGFRLTLSFFRAPKMWEIMASYTRMTGRGSSHISKPTPSQNYLTGTWPQIIPVLSSAKSRIHLNYNLFDLQVDRFFNPNPHMRLRLMAIGSLAWMDQNWVFEYFDAQSDRTKTQNRWEYTAGGLKTGFMVDWFWCYDVYMTLKGIAGGYLGMYSNRAYQNTTYPTVNATPGVPFRNASYSDVRAAFNFQISVGPSWQRSTANNRFEVFAGYELNGWLNLHEVYRSTAGAASDAKETLINSSMLALQGLTTRFTVDF